MRPLARARVCVRENTVTHCDTMTKPYMARAAGGHGKCHCHTKIII